MSDPVRIVEVGPRDGLQNEKTPVSVADRIAFIEVLIAAGLHTVEVGAFVSPKAIPQMVGSDQVLRGVSGHADNEFHVLVPNKKGYEASQAAGAKVIAVFAAASEGFSRANINCTVAESIERFKPVLARARADGIKVRGADLLAASPALATMSYGDGTHRHSAREYILEEIGHYIYVGDSALHIAAAAYQHNIAQALIAAGANVRARNRRGAEPLHYAADGAPGSRAWNPDAQAATIAGLIRADADPNAVDNSGVAPLHRAIRTRCAAAVKALLDGGADVQRENKNGSTPMQLASSNTGRGGSRSPEAKMQQEEIVRLLAQHGAP